MTANPPVGPLRASSHMRLIEGPWGQAAYHAVAGGLTCIDPATADLLRYCSMPRTPSEIAGHVPTCSPSRLDAFLDFFAERSLLVPHDANDDEHLELRRTRRLADLARGRQVRAIQMILSNRCNFRCSYCFEGGGGAASAGLPGGDRPSRRQGGLLMGASDAEAYLDTLLDLVRQAGTDALAIQLFGGEPLVNGDVVKHLLRRFGLGEGRGVRLSWSVVTNGSLVTDELATLFRHCEVPVVVSYDSPASHARRLADGSAVHRVVGRGIDTLRRHGCRVVVNAVLGDLTFHQFDRDLVDFCLARGIHEIGVVLDLDPDFYARREPDAILDRLWNVYRYGRDRGIVVTGYWHQVFDHLVARNWFEAAGYKNCSAMGAQLSIEPDGSVYACKASSGCFGNILRPRELLDSEAFRRYALRACTSPAPCRGCEVEHFCTGLCLGSIETRYGDIDAVEPAACGVYRGATRRLINDHAQSAHLPRFVLT